MKKGIVRERGEHISKEDKKEKERKKKVTDKTKEHERERR